MTDGQRFEAGTLDGAERRLCELEDVASGMGKDEHRKQFRAALVALRHYRKCVCGWEETPGPSDSGADDHKNREGDDG